MKSKLGQRWMKKRSETGGSKYGFPMKSKYRMRTAQTFGKRKRGTSSQLPNGSLKRKEVEARREPKCAFQLKSKYGRDG